MESWIKKSYNEGIAKNREVENNAHHKRDRNNKIEQ